MINNLSFVDHIVFLATMSLCPCSMKAAINNKLYFQKLSWARLGL